MRNLFVFAAPVSMWAALGLSVVLAGCALPPTQQGDARPGDGPAERVAAPGEGTLAQGIKAYQSAQYAEAESLLKLAMEQGLSIGPDRSNALKYLAFIYCTSKREAACAQAFKSARQSDPAFTLSKVEAGHPMWGPVYRKALPPLP